MAAQRGTVTNSSCLDLFPAKTTGQINDEQNQQDKPDASATDRRTTDIETASAEEEKNHQDQE